MGFNCGIKSIAHCDNYIISGDNFGNINRWEIEYNKNNMKRLKKHNLHTLYRAINQIDATSQHIIIGCRNSIKILKYTDDKNGCTEEYEIIGGVNELNVMAISFDPIGTKFVASSIDSRFVYKKSLFLIFDINKNCQVMNKKYDDVCRHLLWEDPHTILMCFKHSIKKMDMRTFEFVRTWDTSKHGGSLCCSSDNRYTFMTGYNTGVLWDQRKSEAIQAYSIAEYPEMHVESLEFDSAHMYVATYSNLYELDFTGRDHFDHEEIEMAFDTFY